MKTEMTFRGAKPPERGFGGESPLQGSAGRPGVGHSAEGTGRAGVILPLAGGPRGFRQAAAGMKKARQTIVYRAFEERQLLTLPTGRSVPSALTGLTSLFGMGRGGTLLL